MSEETILCPRGGGIAELVSLLDDVETKPAAQLAGAVILKNLR